MPIDTEKAQDARKDLTAKDHFYGQMMATWAAYQFEKAKDGAQAGPIWQLINLSQEIQSQIEPEQAIDYALMMISYDEDREENKQDSLFILWLQGNGLQILINKDMEAHVKNKIASLNSDELIGKLDTFLDYKIPYDDIKTKQDLGAIPACYRSFITILLVSLYKDLPQLANLNNKIEQNFRNPQFYEIVKLYSTITDTKDFADKLVELGFHAD